MDENKLKKIILNYHALTSELVTALKKEVPHITKHEAFKNAEKQIYADGYLISSFMKK